MKEKRLFVKRMLYKVKLRCLQCYREPFEIDRVTILDLEYSDLRNLLESDPAGCVSRNQGQKCLADLRAW